jgi:site-specific recombinase XerD
MAGMTLGGLDVPTGRAFVAHLQESPKWESHPGIPTSKSALSAQTVAGHVRVLKAFATWLAEDGYLPTNTLSRLAKPKVPSRVTEVLRADEIKRLLECCDPNSPTADVTLPS